jgi:hypothetical protein
LLPANVTFTTAVICDLLPWIATRLILVGVGQLVLRRIRR